MKKLTYLTALVVVLSLGWLVRRPAPTGSPLPDSQTIPELPSAAPAAPPPDNAGVAVNPGPTTAAAANSPSSLSSSAPAASVVNPPLVPGITPPSRRPWDPAWLQGFAGQTGPVPVQFELLGGEMAVGEAALVQESGDQVVYVAGRLSQPATGSFFFRRQSLPGVAGSHVGVVMFPDASRAFRLEPSSLDGTPELVSRRLGEVVCVQYGLPSGSAAGTQETAPSDPAEAPLVDVGQHPTIPTPDYQNGIPVLESNPGNRAVIYLDLDGETTTQWNGNLIVARRPSFTASQVRELWRAVSADFVSFTINLTTDLRVYERAAENSRIRVIVTPTADAAPGSGGVAFIGSWNWTGDTPCWVFMSTVKDAAEAISHEVGHTLGLGHDGRPNEEYYGGHGSGETGWAPIMGVGYGQPVTQWSKGEYTNASNKEDDLRVITTGNTSVGYRPDDHGATVAAGSYLEIFAGGVVTNRGIIERNTDVDTFRFSTLGGLLNLTARPASVIPNLAIRLELTDAQDQVLLSVSPATTLRASLSTNLPPGDYAVRVRGAGRGANGSVGFSSYASLGFYQLSGTVTQGVQPVRLSVAENSPDGTVVGDLSTMASSPGPWVFQATGGSGMGALALSTSGELTIAQASQFNFEVREQFDLLVDILYPEQPLLNETNRRVVVRIEDVNETPSISAVPFRVFDRTRAGTPVGAVTASDPDLYTRLRFGIGEGNDAGWFDITGSGELRLRRDLESGPTTFHLRVDAWDAGNPLLTNSVAVEVEVLTPPTGLRPGAIAYARYENIPGLTMASLTNHPSFPRSPTRLTTLTNAEIPNRTADLFGGVMRGYFLPPVTGSYNFAVAGDDASELRLSTTDRPEEARRIAFSSAATDPRRWTQVASQRSAAISLEAGRAYYLEARVKEGEGGDHLAVAWSSAAAGSASFQLIPGRYLAPYEIPFAPLVTAQELQVHRNAFAGARWGRVEATDADGDNVFTYGLVSSTIPGLAAVDPATGWIRVADPDLLATTAAANMTLRIRVTDPSGLSSTGNLTCRLVTPTALAADAAVAEIFKNVGGATTMGGLTNNARFPRRPDELRPLSDFALSPNSGNNFGSRIRALVVAPVSGSYRFYIASDDNSELWLGNSANASSARLVARVNGAVGVRNWTAQTGQRSAAITLTANQRYYIEARHKEGNGDDHLAVAWTRPGVTEPTVIPLTSLRALDLGYAPQMSDASATVSSGAAAGTMVADLGATDSPLDLLAWRIAGGNEEGIFTVDPDEGIVSVSNREALLASSRSSWLLTMEVQDSGYGDLYPRQITSAALTITRTGTASPFAAWAESKGIPGARPDDDGDGDGVINLLEYAFGGDPKAADEASLRPRLTLVDKDAATEVQLTFRRRLDPVASGLTYLPEVSPALASEGWGPVTTAGESTSSAVEGLPPGYEEVTLRLAETVPAGDATRFFRIQVSLASP